MEYKQLSQKAVWYFFFQNSIHWFFIFLIMLFFLLNVAWKTGKVVSPTMFFAVTIIFVLFLPMFLACFVFGLLGYRYFRYGFDEKEIRKESGVLSKTYSIVPFTKIQNVEIRRGVAARILDLSDVHIETAGASGTKRAEIVIPALAVEDAEHLRDFLAQKIATTDRTGV